MSNDRYGAWIDQYVASQPHLLGKCREGSEAMVKAFPELRLVRGHVLVAGWGKRGHFWCETPAGEIWDPTSDQFGDAPIFEYEEWKPGDAVRVGKCMNCGDDIWKSVQTLDEDPGHESSCSPECEKELLAEYNGF